MNTAKATVLESFNAPLATRDYPLPQVEAGAALVRTEMAGICGTDVHLWKGELPIALPVILGHETVGRIEQLGPGLDKDWSGQPLKTGDASRGPPPHRAESAITAPKKSSPRAAPIVAPTASV